MKNISREFGLFIDNIRDSRNMSREDFVEDILSTRQYQRYLKGEASITNDKLFLLVDKLEVSFSNIYTQYCNKDNNEYRLVNDIYNLILKLDYKTAYELVGKFEEKTLLSKYNRSFFSYCKITISLNLKLISKDMAMNKYIHLIDYPQCLKYENINFIELITLISLSKYLFQEENDRRIAYFLYKIIREDHLLHDNNIYNKLPSLIASTCQILGILDEHEKVLKLSQKGIDMCLQNQILNSLAHLFYYKSLSLLYIGNKVEALESTKKTFMVLEIQDMPEKTKVFKNLFEKHFQITMEELNSK